MKYAARVGRHGALVLLIAGVFFVTRAEAELGEQFDYTTHDQLKEAIEQQLFEEQRDTVKLTITSCSPDTEHLRRLNEVVETLVTREAYCLECANEFLKYVSSLLTREK